MNRNVCLSFFLVACGAVEQSSGVGVDDVTDVSADELSAKDTQYYVLRKDFRRCASPLCGGYFAKQVNSEAAEVYVNGMTFSGKTLTGKARQDVLDAPLTELVVKGRLSSPEKRFKTQALVVSEAWRGLPGVEVKANDLFLSAARLNLPCRKFGPCAIAETTRLNGLAVPGPIQTGLSLQPMDANVSLDFLLAQILDGGALFSGKVYTSQKPPQPAFTDVEVNQVFLKIPQAWSCPSFKLASCPEGQTWTQLYDSNGCLVPDRCVTPGACIAVFRGCPEGYRNVSYPAGTFACQAVTCEPAFTAVNR
jgi:hypothetical protein